MNCNNSKSFFKSSVSSVSPGKQQVSHWFSLAQGPWLPVGKGINPMLYICTAINMVSLPGVDSGKGKWVQRVWAKHSMRHAAQAHEWPLHQHLVKADK